MTHRDFSVTLHHADFNVLGAGLNNFKQALDREFDGLIARHVVPMVLLQELSDGFRRTTNSICLVGI